jgi:glycosyltransferase involved in cell wall biosynthesis
MMTAGGPAAVKSVDAAAAAARGETVLVSLVVATLDRSEEFRRMLESMRKQTERRFELIIIDQNSDDRLVSIIEGKRADGLVIRHVRRDTRGVCPARNAGLALARAPIVAFPDDDCWYEPDAVANALAYFTAQPTIVGVVGHWVEFDPDRRRPPASLDPRRWRLYKGGDAAAFSLFFRTEALRAVNGFNEYLGPGSYFGCAEEEDLILRLLETNARIDYVPTVHIHHDHSHAPALTDAQRRRNRLYGRGTGAVLAKHKFPLWIVARSLVGPVYHALRAPNKSEALLLGGYTILGRVEGLVGWWLNGDRAAGKVKA